MAKKKAVVDIGHLQESSGAVGNGFREVDLNNSIAKYAVAALERSNIEVLVTQGTLAARCNAEKSFKANCFVSIHNNAGGGDGTEVLYCSNNGKKLAQCLLDTVLEANLNNSRGLKYRNDLYVLKNTASPAALIECAFMDTVDIQAVDEEHERKAFGEMIAKGICKYLGIPFVVASAPASGSFLVRVTADVLNVRKGPGTNYSIATTVKKNEVYTIVDTNGTWGKLKSGAGWISLNYANKIY